MTGDFREARLWLSPDEIQFTLQARPISLQGSARSKAALREAVRKLTRTCDRIAMGDVVLEIEWIVHEDERYTSNQSPDVDNIIKPLLDAVSGPEGLVVNDCQVQSAQAFWVDAPPLAMGFHQLNVRLRTGIDGTLPKAGLYWVECEDRLCFPLWSTYSAEILLGMIFGWERAMAAEADLIAMGLEAHAARMVRPIQPRMHRSRLADFTVVPLAAEKLRLSATT